LNGGVGRFSRAHRRRTHRRRSSLPLALQFPVQTSPLSSPFTSSQAPYQFGIGDLHGCIDYHVRHLRSCGHGCQVGSHLGPAHHHEQPTRLPGCPPSTRGDGETKKNSRQIKYSNTYHTMDDRVPNNGLVFLCFLIWEILAARIEWCFQDTLWSIRPSSTPKHICIVSATHLNYLFLINRMCIAFLSSQESECSRSDIM